jgi:hypothetical protein
MRKKEKNVESNNVSVSDDPHTITEHHRKPTSIGGEKSAPRNISHVPLFKHKAWHILYQDFEAPHIIELFATDYEIHGIDVYTTPLLKHLYEGYANNTEEKIKRNRAWYTIFQGKTLEQIINEINSVWLDPDYEILIGMRRVKTVQLSRKKESKSREKRIVRHM